MSLLSMIPGIPSPTTLLIGGAIILAVAGSSFYEGHHIATQAQASALLKATQVAEAKYQAQVVAYNQVAAQLEVSQNEHKVVTQTVTKMVDRIVKQPIYSHECLDAAGLSAANSALAGSSTRTGQPLSVVPSAPTTK